MVPSPADPHHITIIAEAGINHNGSLQIAREMVDAAHESGADFIKFQTFRTEAVLSRHTPKAGYQMETTDPDESFFEMAKKLELSFDDFVVLEKHCRTRGIRFFSTPFDFDSIEFLMRLGLDTIKVPSGEITNLPYLRKVGGLKKKIIMSTGMAELSEIGDALNVLYAAGTAGDAVTVLHCNTDYPTGMEDVNLRAMLTIRDAFNVPVGYSDHTMGIEVPIAAAALGAMVIEKHFTLDRTMEGPDQKASLEPAEFTAMISAVRNIEKALGSTAKVPSPSESKVMPIARRSIVAARDISAGEVFTEQNIAAKRPGTGINPMRWDEVVGTRAKKNFNKDELIEL